MTLSADHVGQRMTIRYVVGGPGPSGGPALTDVVGRILAVSGAEATVERRDGSTVVVRLGDIVAAKVVPARPTRSRGAMQISADNLSRIASRGWPAIHSRPLGEWELRASAGFTARANSVAVSGSPGIPDAEAVAAVTEFYASHGLDPLAQVIVGSPGERLFIEAGWRPVEARAAGAGAVVQVAELPVGSAGEGVSIDDRASIEWMHRYHRIEADPDVAQAILEGPATVAFLSIGDPITAIGRVVVSGEWAGMSCVEVDPAHRRQGLARRVVESGLAWAREQGADKAYLQIKTGNDAAMALYAPYGFTTHHSYAYLAQGFSSQRTSSVAR